MFNLQLNAYTTAISSVNKIVIKEWLRLNIFRFLMEEMMEWVGVIVDEAMGEVNGTDGMIMDGADNAD